jgi:hypothetical protein
MVSITTVRGRPDVTSAIDSAAPILFFNGFLMFLSIYFHSQAIQDFRFGLQLSLGLKL